MKIIFLDIDGVLNCRLDFENRQENMIRTESGEVSKRCVELLNNLTDKTGAKIVVSSVWRFDGLKMITESLKSAGVTGEIIGVTGDGCSCCLRGNEILKWIKDNKEMIGKEYQDYKDYIILDDDSDMLYWQRQNYFQVDPYCGLTPNLVYRATRFLNNPVFDN